MESMVGFIPAAPWIEMFFVGTLVLIMISYFISTAQAPVKRMKVECPEIRSPLKVLMKVNIFRDPRKIGKGLDVVRCPEFAKEEIICSKGCLFSDKAQQAHQAAGRRHIEKTRILTLQQ
jgi:hypothetical protein